MRLVTTFSPSYYITPLNVLLLFIVLRTTSAFKNDYDPCNDTDRIALLAIKARLIDTNPDRVLSSWNRSFHHCNWEGVTCGRKHSRVVQLNLYSRGLAGVISPFIGNLTFLKQISLFNNNLTGTIPLEIGHLSNLQILELYNNKLTGEIPANLTGIKNLQVFDLSINKLKGKLPSSLVTLTRLQKFVIADNNFSGSLFRVIANISSIQWIYAAKNEFTGTVPDSIGMLQNLTYFSVENNNLNGIFPKTVFNISTLEELNLGQNNLQGKLPDDIGAGLPQLSEFNLDGNQFSGTIPMSVTNLSNLIYLELAENQFTGSVPNDYSHLYNLSWVDLSSNNLVGDIKFISTLTNCTNLEVLDVSENEFSGTLPTSVANLSTNLNYFRISSSRVSGSMPKGIENLINLVHLAIYDSNLTGSILQSLGKLPKLEQIILYNNKLTDIIPDSLGNLTYLSMLSLSENKLQGRIPSSLGDCQYLEYLSLGNNELRGALPSKLFGGSAQFVEVDMSQNRLEGIIPSKISKQINVVKFYAFDNELSGELPGGFGACTALQVFLMQGNRLGGSVPESLAALKGLQILDLSRNNFSGQIPVYLSKFPLSYLNLSYNNFNGMVPTLGVFGNASAVSLVGNCGLCGGISNLHLPRCLQENERKRKTLPLALKLSILITATLIGVLIMVVACYVMTRKKRSKKSDSPKSVAGIELLKVSYSMLLRATDDFSSENLLGIGSFGSVFKGVLDEKMVAVKVLNLQNRGGSKSFLAECKALRNVRHRNLVGIITACSSTDFQGNDFKALVYEFMSKGSLDKWLHGDENLTLLQRVDIAIDVANALNYLYHECDISMVHCDLKPTNILLDKDMVAHVGDFGEVKFLAQPQQLHQSSSVGVRGTCGYVAPEYGLGGRASREGDLYSYGIVLLELMTGKRPTDDIFKENLNLHKYAQAALPDQLMQIIDPTLEEEEITEDFYDERAIKERVQRRLECIAAMVDIGVACSNHLPQDRMKIGDVISRLRAAREILHNTTQRRQNVVVALHVGKQDL